MKRLGAIDLGTNSARLLVVEKKNPLDPIYRGIEVTRLGEGVNEKRFLQSTAIQRTIQALHTFQAKVRELNVEKLRIVATSAVRDATNKEDFIDEVKRETGLVVEVIPGKEEAQLTYWGVTADLAWPLGNILAFDLGGGSTELVLGNRETVHSLTSVDVGAVRMTEAFLHSNPVLEEEYQRMKEYLNSALFPNLGQLKNQGVAMLVGVGGTATSLAAMAQELVPYDPNKVHGYYVSLQKVKELRQKIKGAAVEERQQFPGLHPKRADIILGGVAVVETLLEGLDLDKFMVSENDLLLGMILKQLR